MWTTEFTREQETIGTMTATFDKGGVNEFVFKGSVNLDDTTSLQEFVLTARKSLIARDNRKVVPQRVTDIINLVTTNLNK